MTDKQKAEAGDESVIMQAQDDGTNYKDCTFVMESQKEDQDFGFLDEIFEFVLSEIEKEDVKNEEEPEDGHIHPEEKIKLNFQSEEDREAVRQYLRYAYTKQKMIERRIQEEDNESQKDLHQHMFRIYRKVKGENEKSIDVLENLMDEFVPNTKKDNASYTAIAKAFVLFFFDDCTIFEKTEIEKQTRLTF